MRGPRAGLLNFPLRITDKGGYFHKGERVKKIFVAAGFLALTALLSVGLTRCGKDGGAGTVQVIMKGVN